MKQLWMDWQLFAEGESAPEGAGEGQDSTPPDAGEDFEALIRGRCKEEFDARVKKILDGRLRGLRQENQRLRQAESARQVQALERLERDAAAVRQMYSGVFAGGGAARRGFLQADSGGRGRTDGV